MTEKEKIEIEESSPELSPSPPDSPENSLDAMAPIAIPTNLSETLVSVSNIKAMVNSGKIGGGKIYYGNCETAASVAAKKVELVGNTNFTLEEGATVFVNFVHTNTASVPTLSINNTSGYMYLYGTTRVGTTPTSSWSNNSIVGFTYGGQGEGWKMLNSGLNSGGYETISNLGGAYQFTLFCNTNYYRTFVKKTTNDRYNTSFLITGGSNQSAQNLATYLVEIHGVTSPYARVYELTPPSNQNYTLNFYTYLDADSKINFCVRSPSYPSHVTVTVLGDYTKGSTTFDENIYYVLVPPTPVSGSLNTITVQKVAASRADIATKADTLTNSRNLGVALGTSNTTGASFNGSANQLSIPVSGTLGVENGGTGKSLLATYQPLIGGTTATGAIQQMTSTNTGAMYRTSTTALPTWGTLPVAQGGTGATTKGYTAMNNLGGAYQFTLICGTNYYKTFIKMKKNSSTNCTFLISGAGGFSDARHLSYLVELRWPSNNTTDARVTQLTGNGSDIEFYTYLDSDGLINFCIRSAGFVSYYTVTILGNSIPSDVTIDPNIYDKTTAPTPGSGSLNTITVQKIEAEKAKTADTLTNSRNLGVALGTSNTTGATFNGSANQLNIPVSGTLGVVNGGTGKSSLTAYQPLIGGTSTTGAIQQMTSTNTGAMYRTSTTALPIWGTLPVNQGGTGKTEWTASGVLYASATNTLSQVTNAAGALYKTGATNTPIFGVLPVEQGGTGAQNNIEALQNLNGALQINGFSPQASQYVTAFASIPKGDGYKNITFLISAYGPSDGLQNATYLLTAKGTGRIWAIRFCPNNNDNCKLKFYTYIEDSRLNIAYQSVAGGNGYFGITVIGGYYYSDLIFKNYIKRHLGTSGLENLSAAQIYTVPLTEE